MEGAFRPYVKRLTGHTRTHTTAEQTTHTNTERATAQRQRRLLVEVVVPALKLPLSAALLLSSLLPTRGTGRIPERTTRKGWECAGLGVCGSFVWFGRVWLGHNKVFFYVEAFVRESIILFANTPWFGHTTTPLHHPHCCAVNYFPATPPPLKVPCA